MKHSLKARLSLSYAVLALLIVAIISLFSNFFLKKQFESYVIQQLTGRIEETIAQTALEYDADTQRFSINGLEAVGINALEHGLILKVSDAQGQVLWDARVHNDGLCNQMLVDMANNMQSHYASFQGAYEEKEYPITAAAVRVGSVTIGYYGPFYFNQSDTAFLDMLNRILLSVGILALAAALSLGLYMASRISKPISQTIEATERIARGEYQQRIEQGSNTRELDRLIASVNSLSLKLQQQDTLRKHLTADIAHELRTPLTALQGNMEAFIDGVLPADEEHLQSCHEEIMRLTRLVNDLEKLSQLENEGAPLDLTEFDVKELAQRAAMSFEPEFMAKHIALSVTGSTEIIVADRDKIRQVFNNLISNALKYTPIGGTIEIIVTDRDQAVQIQVKDNGIGIASEHHPYLFERFYRVDPSRSSKSGGAGIGLAIVKTIVQMHGGHIAVQSAVGKGTTFTVKLPKRPAV